MLISFDLDASFAIFGVGFTHLVQHVDELRLGDWSLEGSSLCILNDNVLNSVRFSRVHGSDIAKANPSFFTKDLLQHGVFLLSHSSFLFFLLLTFLHLLLHLLSLGWVLINPWKQESIHARYLKEF